MSPGLKLGTALFPEGASERRALVAPLPSDPGRVVDLNRIEQVRLRKLGEGHWEALAEVRVPPSLRRALEGGPRVLARIRQALAYAEKWARRGNLPEALAPRVGDVALLPCLPRPAAIRHLDGTHRDRLELLGTRRALPGRPQAALGALGLFGGRIGGYCLAVEVGGAVGLGTWMTLELAGDAVFELMAGLGTHAVPAAAWEGLELPRLRPAEVLLLPAPVPPEALDLHAGYQLHWVADFDNLHLRVAKEELHPTVQ